MAAPGSSSRCVVALCYRRTRYSSASGSAPLPAGSPAPPDLGSSWRSCASSSPGWSLHQACERAARALERPAKWGSLSLRAAQCPVKKIVGTIEEAARPFRFDIKMKIYKYAGNFPVICLGDLLLLPLMQNGLIHMLIEKGKECMPGILIPKSLPLIRALMEEVLIMCTMLIRCFLSLLQNLFPFYYAVGSSFIGYYLDAYFPSS